MTKTSNKRVGASARPIFLLGFMCSGKTTLGQALGRTLGRNFVDLDTYIEIQRNKTINEIFASEGEKAFRIIEKKCLDDLIEETGIKPAVIALGGGTVCSEGVMDRLNKAGTTVFLQAPRERIVERLLLEPEGRPLIRNKTKPEIEDFVASKLTERMPFYMKACHTFDSSHLETAAEIEESVQAFISLLGIERND